MNQRSDDELHDPFVRKDESFLSQQRQRVAAIAELLDREALRQLTEATIEQLEADLREIIVDISKLPDEEVEEVLQAKEAVLINLREARDELNMAVDQLVTKGRTRQFYQCLRNCRNGCEKALQYW